MGGVMARFRREIEAAPDPEAKKNELEARVAQGELIMYGGGTGTSKYLDIIDPRETRPLLCNFARDAQEITATQLGPKFRGIRP